MSSLSLSFVSVVMLSKTETLNCDLSGWTERSDYLTMMTPRLRLLPCDHLVRPHLTPHTSHVLYMHDGEEIIDKTITDIFENISMPAAAWPPPLSQYNMHARSLSAIWYRGETSSANNNVFITNDHHM